MSGEGEIKNGPESPGYFVYSVTCFIRKLTRQNLNAGRIPLTAHHQWLGVEFKIDLLDSAVLIKRKGFVSDPWTTNRTEASVCSVLDVPIFTFGFSLAETGSDAGAPFMSMSSNCNTRHGAQFTVIQKYFSTCRPSSWQDCIAVPIPNRAWQRHRQ